MTAQDIRNGETYSARQLLLGASMKDMMVSLLQAYLAVDFTGHLATIREIESAGAGWRRCV